MAYKGNPIDAALLQRIKHALPGVFTVNVYPDCSPHAHGARHREAVGKYDLVISTKPYHPGVWATTYGYTNPCRFVPQGYDPILHLVDDPPARAELDVAMVATWRPEYHRLMLGLARELQGSTITVGLGGNGWAAHASDFPPNWRLLGELTGRAYIQFLRSGRICIAPLNREMNINGHAQPGDVDTTRSYELPAAHCFFLHQRTPYIRSVYEEASEVPMFDDAIELAAHIRHYLMHANERAELALRAHNRAVPNYSTDARAAAVIKTIEQTMRRQE
jgi:spore maturation protein CgeB